MSRVTSKLQVTIPKAIAQRYGIAPGQEIDWLDAGEAIRVVPEAGRQRRANVESRLALYDAATVRQRARDETRPRASSADRGWTREELYRRGGAA
ncbi:MAG: AbrB/MazE/SpoVT family DNA-binding domain-containing protein [Solirubrobacteraceae bacterium]